VNSKTSVLIYPRKQLFDTNRQAGHILDALGANRLDAASLHEISILDQSPIREGSTGVDGFLSTPDWAR